MTDEKMLQPIFSSLRAYLHQDAPVHSSLENILFEWTQSLTTTQRTTLFEALALWLSGTANAPSIKSLMRNAAPDWNIPERKLKIAFRKLKDQHQHA